MTPYLDALNKYLQHDLESVPGWLSPGDCLLMACAGIVQNEQLPAGDLFEIGVYQGKSLIVLGMLCRDGERAHGLDMFAFCSGDLARENAIRLCPKPDVVQLHLGNSLDHDLDSLRATLGANSVRYVHVDGGHEYFEVLHDLLLVSDLVREDGVMIVDDVHDREFPGIPLALEDFFARQRTRGGFVPFMIGLNKAFLCRANAVCWYQKRLATLPVLRGKMRISRARNHDVLVPSSQYPMLPEDLDSAISHPPTLPWTVAAWSYVDLKGYAREHGSNEMYRSVDRNK